MPLPSNFMTRKDEIIASVTKAMERLGFSLGFVPSTDFPVMAKSTGSPEWGAVELLGVAEWALDSWPTQLLVISRIEKILRKCEKF